MTVENPASSTLWTCPVGRKCLALGLLKTTLHPCMCGAAHPTRSALFHNFPEVRRLCLLRDGQHQHASWDKTNSVQLSACPLEMCHAGPQPAAKDYLNQVVLVELPRSASFAPHRLPRVSSPKETAFLPWSHPRELRCTSRTGPLHAAHGCVEEVHRSSTRSPRCPQSVVFPQVPRAPGLCCTGAGAPTMGPFVKLVFAVLLQPSHS